jgi:uncharacterized NAD-dependent epimerase/dehydratase family protein
VKKAIILAEGFFGTNDGKTAHGLLRYSAQYKVVGVIDSEFKGMDSGLIIDGKPNGIMVYESLEEGLKAHPDAEVLIIGVATEGGYLPKGYREIIRKALERGVSIVSGLHEFLSDDPELMRIARNNNAEIIDVRKIFRDMKIPFRGVIKEVKALKVVVLGTDSVVGKRTTAIMINNELLRRGIKSVFIGTGQTSWMQGFKYTVVIDALINDFVAGAIEDIIWRAYKNEKPDVIVISGQGSILHPAFPGSFEILAAAKPEFIVLQHAPKRKFFDGFPGFEIPSIDRYIRAINILTERNVEAITINHENMSKEEVNYIKREYEQKYNVVVCDPLWDGVGKIVDIILEKYLSVTQ